ncbi:hypothetical protein [Lysinibacillus sp. NPDC056185]|uniref:hypothetical protein n=1 Tax=Lysinibacillus sp. NPDC056185 TaxID=3345739 RepID=UPI0039EE66C4
MYIAKKYKANSGRSNANQKVFVFLMTSPQQVLNKTNNEILEALQEKELANSLGIYFYRFKNLNTYNAFTKIGEVSRIEGIEKRFIRGWHGTTSYGDTYLSKKIHNDVNMISTDNPMYFVFYEFDLLNSFPKIDEQIAFKKHLDSFNTSTRNFEKPHGNYQLGINLVWHDTAFDEVLNLNFPDGTPYPF